MFVWLINIFNPPPLESMSPLQKMSRALFITVTIVVACILFAMLGALGIYVLQRGSTMLGSVPELVNGLGVILVSGCVNGICVWVLLRIKRADSSLMPASPETPSHSS